ncbi:hypothetical protein GEV33_013127 [Tenebrio molitor]|uniref:Uncharacterized protein n=1 Tax=Tenebrio molitor TaxID=7067 RepID=A0A8J6H0T5_TENMO|nr:hypothetical protein GEV33_013127 [Tenebrio molitor]
MANANVSTGFFRVERRRRFQDTPVLIAEMEMKSAARCSVHVNQRAWSVHVRNEGPLRSSFVVRVSLVTVSSVFYIFGEIVGEKRVILARGWKRACGQKCDPRVKNSGLKHALAEVAVHNRRNGRLVFGKICEKVEREAAAIVERSRSSIGSVVGTICRWAERGRAPPTAADGFRPVLALPYFACALCKSIHPRQPPNFRPHRPPGAFCAPQKSGLSPGTLRVSPGGAPDGAPGARLAENPTAEAPFSWTSCGAGMHRRQAARSPIPTVRSGPLDISLVLQDRKVEGAGATVMQVAPLLPTDGVSPPSVRRFMNGFRSRPHTDDAFFLLMHSCLYLLPYLCQIESHPSFMS